MATKKKNAVRVPNPKFAAGKKVNLKKAAKLVKAAKPARVVQAIVLDRVAKTFAYLQEERERSNTPRVENDILTHTDDRGSIFNIIHNPVGAVAIITSKTDTVRANHWHREDAHLCYVISGSIEYYERPVGSKVEPRRFVIKSGEAFYTGSRMEHAMHFLEDTVFLTLGRLSRTPTDYENDLVRLTEDAQLARPQLKVEVTIPTKAESVGEEVALPPTDVATTPAPNTPPAEG